MNVINIAPTSIHKTEQASASSYVQVQVHVPTQLLASLSHQLCSSSTSISSLTIPQRQLLSSTACLLPDCTLFPPSQSAPHGVPDVDPQHCTSPGAAPGRSAQASWVEPVLCVEIKPKWGLLPTSPAIPAKHEIKRHKSRLQLHQKLKLAQVCAYVHVRRLIGMFCTHLFVAWAILVATNSQALCIPHVYTAYFYSDQCMATITAVCHCCIQHCLTAPC